MGFHPSDVAVATLMLDEGPPIRRHNYKKNWIFTSSVAASLMCKIQGIRRLPSSITGIPRNTMHRSRKAGKKCLME